MRYVVVFAHSSWGDPPGQFVLDGKKKTGPNHHQVHLPLWESDNLTCWYPAACPQLTVLENLCQGLADVSSEH